MPAGRPLIGGVGASAPENVQRHEGPTAPTAFDSSGEGYGYKVVASEYSSSESGPWDGHNGMTFAELSDNATNYANGSSASGGVNDYHAMGGLPMGTKLNITYNGKTVSAYKADVGFGGAGMGGIPRVIDLYTGTAEALNFDGLGYVYISRADGLPMHFPPSSQPDSASGVAKGAKGEGGEATSGGIPVGAVASAVTSPLGGIADFFGKLGSLFFTSAGWLRLLKVFAGVTLALFALHSLFSGTAVGDAVSDTGKAAGMAVLA
jgi:hypothetical protein